MMKPEEFAGKPVFSRLKLVGAGVVLALIGFARLRGGVQVVLHSNNQPMFSWGLIATGIVCFALSLIPISWVVKAAGTPDSRRRSHR